MTRGRECTGTSIHTYIHIYIHTYTHTYREAEEGRKRLEEEKAHELPYIHTYIHTYMHTCIQRSGGREKATRGRKGTEASRCAGS